MQILKVNVAFSLSSVGLPGGRRFMEGLFPVIPDNSQGQFQKETAPAIEPARYVEDSRESNAGVGRRRGAAKVF